VNKKTHYFIYSLGNFANTLVYQVFSNRIQFFYIDVVGLAPAVAGTIWTLFGVWNAVVTPLGGVVSDRTRSRWGRRVPYVLFGTVPLALVFIFLWTPPTANKTLTAIYFLVCLFFFDTLYNLITTAYTAMFPEIAANLADRSLLAAFREGLATIALLLAFVLAPILSESVGFVWMGVVIGLLTAVTYLASMWGTREDLTRLPEASPGLIASVLEAIKSKPFLYYVGALITREFMLVTVVATLPFWRKYALAITASGPVFGAMLAPGDQEAILLGLPMLLSVGWVFVWNLVIPKIGARRAWMYAYLIIIPGLLVMTLARGFYWGLAGTLLISPALAGIMMSPYILLSQVIDDDAARHGARREGMLFGISVGAGKFSYAIQGILFTLILPLSGYVANAAHQAESAIWGIRFLTGGAPVLVGLAGVWFLANFPLADRRG
jgi:GPH family glycoside/pentoside/hexuronide:cation symporter